MPDYVKEIFRASPLRRARLCTRCGRPFLAFWQQTECGLCRTFDLFLRIPMKKYRRPDTGEIVSVERGLGDLWIAGMVKPNGSVSRLKTQAIPACSSREDCQAELDAYAMMHGWPEAKP